MATAPAPCQWREHPVASKAGATLPRDGNHAICLRSFGGGRQRWLGLSAQARGLDKWTAAGQSCRCEKRLVDLYLVGRATAKRRVRPDGIVEADVAADIGFLAIRSTLPFADGCVDTVFSNHGLEYILFDQAVIGDWYRVLKFGGHIVCIAPSQALYEKRRFLSSKFNADHKRMYTPASLAASFEKALDVNSYRLRHLRENDKGYDYGVGQDEHAVGAYEIEMVLEKIEPPIWTLA